MWNFLLNRALAWLAGLTPDQLETAARFVRTAATSFIESTDKRAFVDRHLRLAFPTLKDAARNLLIEVAVSYVRRNPTT